MLTEAQVAARERQRRRYAMPTRGDGVTPMREMADKSETELGAALDSWLPHVATPSGADLAAIVPVEGQQMMEWQIQQERATDV